MSEERIEELWKQAAQIPDAAAREEFLTEACGKDAALREAVSQRLEKESEESLPVGSSEPSTIDGTIGSSDGESEPVEPPSGVTRVVTSDGVELPPAGDEAQGGGTESLDRYELQDEIARGGMGIVHRARDLKLGRDLAVKVLSQTHLQNPRSVARFVGEAQIGGQLQHPGIAPIYDLGRFSDQRPFFTMKLVKGKTLAQLLAEGEKLEGGRARLLQIFEQVCQTMAYAHSRGVIHRDLKPANIMVGAFGEVQVMDWGIAKILGDEPEPLPVDPGTPPTVVQIVQPDSGEETPKTQDGMALGTPSYMPPEQALGELDNVDARADVFALGSILCEILTGQPVYPRASLKQNLKDALRGRTEDASPRLESSGADAAIIELAKDCLAPDLADRPENAGAIADRLGGYFHGVQQRLHDAELAKVEADAQTEAAHQRRRLYVLLSGLMLAVALGAVTVAEWFRQDRKFHEELANDNHEKWKQVLVEKQNVLEQKELVEKQRRRAEANLQLAEEESERRRQLLYAADMTLAPLLWQDESGTADALARVLQSQVPGDSESDLRGFEWKLYDGLLNGSSISIDETAEALAVRQDGTIVVVTGDFRIQHRDPATGKIRRELSLEEPSENVTSLTLSEDGRFLAWTTTRLFVVDCATGESVFEIEPTGIGPLRHVGFSTDAGFIYVCGKRPPAGEFAAWDLKTKSPAQLPSVPSGGRAPFVFNTTARSVARLTGRFRNTLEILRLNNEGAITTTDSYLPFRGASTRGIALSLQGDLAFLTGVFRGSAALLNTRSGEFLENPPTHLSEITAASFAGDSASLATGSRDGLIKLWAIRGDENGKTVEAVSSLKGHRTPVLGLTHTADGKRLVSFDSETIRIWDLSKSQRLRRTLPDQSGTCYQLVFSPDNRWLVSVEDNPDGVQLRDAKTGEVVWSESEANEVTSASFSPGSRLVAFGHHGGDVSVWSIETREQLAKMEAPTANAAKYDPISLAFSPVEGPKELAIGFGLLAAHNTAIRPQPVVWNFESGQLETTLRGHRNACPAMLYRIHDEQPELITASHVGQICFFKPGDDQPANTIRNPDTTPIGWGSSVADIQFSSDGKTLGAASEGGSIHLIDLQTGEIRRSLKGHSGRVYGIAFSPDGRTLASASTDQTVRLWNLATGRELAQFAGDRSYYTIAFSPNGQQLLAGGQADDDGSGVDVWRLP